MSVFAPPCGNDSGVLALTNHALQVMATRL